MNRGNFALEGDEEMKRNCCGFRGRGFDDFTRDDLRDIILHKNKVIADLEEHAYGSASWIERLNKGLKVAKEIKGKVDKKPPKESEADFRKRLEDFDKERDAPSEEWGADELNGDGLFDDITAAMGDYQKEKKDAYDKLPEAEKNKLETERKKSIAAKRAEVIKEAEQKAIKYLDEDKDKPYYEKSLKLKLGNLTREQYIQNFKDKRAKSFDEAKGGGPIQSILERRNRVQPLPLRPRTPPVFYTPPPPPPGPSIYGTPVYSSNPAAATAAASAAAPSPALPGAPMLSARIQPALGAPAPPPPAAGVPQPPPPPQLRYDFDCPPQYTTIIRDALREANSRIYRTSGHSELVPWRYRRRFDADSRREYYKHAFPLYLGSNNVLSSLFTQTGMTATSAPLLNRLAGYYSRAPLQAQRPPDDAEEDIDRVAPQLCSEVASICQDLSRPLANELASIRDVGRQNNRSTGSAAPTPTEPKISPVAAAAAALQPVRTAIQNGIGDAIYGKSDDPRKQKKGLLGISEEGKEESQKKVMKNIVVPIAKTAISLGTSTKDIANMVFNPGKYDDDMTERRIKRIKAEEAKAGIVRDKTNPMIIIRKPRGFWTAETSDPKEEAYNQKRAAWRGADNVFYIRVPNPIFAAKLKPSMRELEKARVKLWTGVQQNDPKRSEDVDGTLKSLHDDEFIFIPEDRAKEIYGQLRQFVADKQDEGVMEGYEDEGWTKGQLKEFAKIDPRTLKGQELFDYKQVKLALDKSTTRNAEEKVNKDIAEEQKKATPDQARLAKMREAKVRVEKRLKDLDLRGQKEFNEGVEGINAERDKLQGDYYAKQRAAAQANIDQDAADQAEFQAKPVAEKIAIYEEMKRQMEMRTGVGGFPDYDDEIAELRAQEASEKAKEQAQGSVDLLQQAQVGGGISSSKTNKVAPEPPSGPVSAVQYPIRNAVVGQVVGCSEADTAVILAALKLANKVGKDAIVRGGYRLSIGALKIEYTDNFRAAVRGSFYLYEFFHYQTRGQDLVIYMSDVAAGNVVGRPPLDDIIREAANEVCLWTLNEIQRRRDDKVAVFDEIKRNTAQVRIMTGNGMTGSAKPTNPALYAKAKAIADKTYSKPSAYKSGFIVKKYKEMGGEYEDEPDGKRPLERWFKEDWKDVGNKEYPVYRPTKRVSKDTPLTPDEIDPENLKLQIKEKQKIKGEQNLSAFKKRGGADRDDDDDKKDAKKGKKRDRSPSPFLGEEAKDDDDDDDDDDDFDIPFAQPRVFGEDEDDDELPAGAFFCSVCDRDIQQGTDDWDGRARVDGEDYCGLCAKDLFEASDMEAEDEEEEPAMDAAAIQAMVAAAAAAVAAAPAQDLELDELLEEIKKRQMPRGGADSESDDGMVGSGAVEYTLQKAGKSLFNPSGDMSKAGRQSFTPDYDAYGDTVQQGRQNAFNLAKSMYDQTKAIELPDFTLLRDDTSLRFYRKHDEDVILVGIRGTDVKSWKDLYTWAVIGANQDLRMTTRFQDDLAKLVSFQRNYSPSQFYYVATGSSLAGSIADRFLEMGLIEEAITYNPSIERKYVLEEGVLNHRVYLDTDPLFMLMGQYAPNTEIRVNPNKTNFYNPSKEKDYLIASHSIYPVYNPAFEGGGMEGSGKTYTIEEWKAIFDAKLEQKRKAIEAREAKKKQTAKAKRERAKARRDARKQEPAPEEEEPEVEVAEYRIEGKVYLVEEPREGLAFAERRVFDDDNEEIGNLTEDDVGKTLVMRVMRQEKLGAFADKSPKAKSSSESLPFFESQQRNPAGEFAKAKSPKEIIDEMVEDAVKDIYYKEFPDIMKGTVSKEKLYRDKFLTLPKKKQDELRKKVRERVMSQLK